MTKIWKPFCLFYSITVFHSVFVLFFQSEFQLKELYETTKLLNTTILLNFFLIGFTFLLLWAITRKLWFSWSVLSAILTILLLINYFKIKYTSAPLVLGDFTFVKNAKVVLSYLSFIELVLGMAAIVVVLAIVAFIFIKDKTNKKTARYFKPRMVILAGWILFLAIFLQGRGQENNFYAFAEKIGFDTEVKNVEESYKKNGFLVGVLLSNSVPGYKVVNYTAQDVAPLNDMVKSFTPSEEASNEVVVYILSESFFDPLRMNKIEVSEDPIPTIRRLMNENTSGHLKLTKSTFGTSLTEYEAVTSMPYNFFSLMKVPYNDYVHNLAYHPNVGDLFDYQMAIHTYDAELYNREQIYADVYHYEKFKYAGSETNDLIYKKKINNKGFISDESGYKEVLAEIRDVPKDQTGFISYITVQNHTPYKEEYYSSLAYDVKLKEDNPDLTEEELTQLKIYLQGLRFTDRATEKFIRELDKMKRKVTVVFYGDHRPRLKGIDSFVDEEAALTTDYFIYQNYQQEKLDYPLISMNYLASVMLKLTTIEKSPFYEFLDQQLELTPVLLDDTVLKDDEYIPRYADKDIAKSLQYYEMIQADNLDQHYLIDRAFYENK